MFASRLVTHAHKKCKKKLVEPPDPALLEGVERLNGRIKLSIYDRFFFLPDSSK